MYNPAEGCTALNNNASYSVGEYTTMMLNEGEVIYLEVTNNGTVESAFVIEVNEDSKSATELKDQAVTVEASSLAWYTFTVPETGEYSFTAEFSENSELKNGSYGELYCYKPNANGRYNTGTSIFAQYTSGNKTSVNIEVSLTVGQKIFLQVDNSNSEYSIQLKAELKTE